MVQRYFKDRFYDKPVENFEPKQFIDFVEKDTWSLGKQSKYCQNLRRTLTDPKFRDYLGVFSLMVKSGEVYYSTDPMEYDSRGYTVGRSDRPRAVMNPCDKGCGILAAVQSQLWQIIKDREPGFIQGYDKQDFEDLLKGKVQDDWESLSLDGAAFDSSQFAILQEIVEDQFWEWARPLIREMIDVQFGRELPTDMILDNFMKAVKKKENIVFVRIPEVDAPEWPPEIQKIFRECYGDQEQPWKDHIYIELYGTTFSGHSIRTTLGNTFRSLTYAFYYFETQGLISPWNLSDLFVMAAGDDTASLHHPKYSVLVKRAILLNTARQKKSDPLCLGQCVESV